MDGKPCCGSRAVSVFPFCFGSHCELCFVSCTGLFLYVCLFCGLHIRPSLKESWRQGQRTGLCLTLFHVKLQSVVSKLASEHKCHQQTQKLHQCKILMGIHFSEMSPVWSLGSRIYCSEFSSMNHSVADSPCAASTGSAPETRQ